MSGDGYRELILPRGLDASNAEDFNRLVADVSAQPDAMGTLPYLAPALLFADEAVHSKLVLPSPQPGRILVQDYLAITNTAAILLDTGLKARLKADRRANTAEYRIVLADEAGLDCVRLEIALRLLSVQDFLSAKSAQFRRDTMLDTTWSDEIWLSQAHVDRYLALSGDLNPIHADPHLAGVAGLNRAIVPGLLTVSLIQPFCFRAVPGASMVSLKVRFLAPLFVNDPVRIGIQRRGTVRVNGETRLRCYLLGDKDQALAIADLVFKGPAAAA